MLYTHLAAALAALAIGATGAWKLQAWRWAAADAERIQAEQETQRLAARRTDSAAERYETQRAAGQAAARVIVREVERVVESPVYRDVCLDPAGLQLVARAVSGAADDPGSAAPAMPAASAAR